MKEIGAPGENQRPAASHKQTLSYYFVLSTPRHTITTTTTPVLLCFVPEDHLFKSFLAGVLCVCLSTFTFKTMLYFIVLAAVAGYDLFHYAE